MRTRGALACIAFVALAGCAASPTQSARGPDTAPFLLLREFDWLNASADAPPVGADFGPHCAMVSYTLDPPAVTMLGGAAVAEAPAFLVRDFRDSPRVDNSYTMSADRLDHDAGRTFTIASPYQLLNTSIILAWASLEGADFVIERESGGAKHRLAQGESATIPIEYGFTLADHEYHGAHVLVFTNVGEARMDSDAARGICR